jgi:hypothetical protein
VDLTGFGFPFYGTTLQRFTSTPMVTLTQPHRGARRRQGMESVQSALSLKSLPADSLA